MGAVMLFCKPGMESSVIEPIGQQQRLEVKEATEEFICLAEQFYQCRFGRIPVLFDLRGRAAGMFKVVGKERCIRYNPWIFAKYYEENLADTVPHEVAHYIMHEVYGMRRVRPHGEQWRTLMRCFGASEEVTFNLDLAGIPQRSQRTHPYRCDCRTHEVSTTRHNRVLKGAGRYQCRYCDGQLVYAP